MMVNTKHPSKAGFYVFITNIKYALFGYLPKFTQRHTQDRRSGGKFRPRGHNNNFRRGNGNHNIDNNEYEYNVHRH